MVGRRSATIRSDPALSPVAEHGIHKGESGHGGRIGPQNARPQRDARDEWLGCEKLTLGPVEAALGSDQQRQRAGQQAAERGQGIKLLAALIAENQPAGGIPAGNGPLQFHRLVHGRHAQYAALLGRLDGIGAHALGFDPLGLRVLRQDRLQHGGGAAILDLLKQGGAEIAIAGPIEDNWERLDHWPLFEEPFELAVRADHPLAMDNEITLEKLQKVPVFCQVGCEMHGIAARMVTNKGLSTTNMHDVVTYHDLMALVASGVGVAIVPRSAPQSDSIRRAPIADLPLSRTVSVYAIAGRKREAATAAFLNLLRSTEFAG